MCIIFCNKYSFLSASEYCSATLVGIDIGEVLRDGARRDDLLLQVVVDSGCTFFITPHRHYFIESTIKPTTQTMRGVDGRPTTLLGEGIAVLNIQDPNDNIIYRIAVPALLSSEGITLLSVEQLHQ